MLQKRPVGLILLRISLILCLFGLVLTAGCANTSKKVGTKGGLYINSWISSLGTVDGTTLDKTRFSYSVYITNESNNKVLIKSIHPKVNDNISCLLVSNNTPVPVEKEINPSDTLQIDGKLIFSTSGMTKADIEKLHPFITDVLITSETLISLN